VPSASSASARGAVRTSSRCPRFSTGAASVTNKRRLLDARRSVADTDGAAGARAANPHRRRLDHPSRPPQASRDATTRPALLGPDGGRIAVYRKIHLFDVDLPGRVTVRESDAKLAGADIVTGKTPLGTIGLTICYDLRFRNSIAASLLPVRKLSTIPSAFTFPTGEAHLGAVAPRRAIENQAYVIAPAQFGPTSTAIATTAIR